ncbi:hypothetical protein EV421DRAFT_1733258 [Armillaria borealis]|uniref:Uncharacterized protein n=1 Tax=Armillaria borealis TaxID=47425 RepID=A0AA39JVA5_9AGAR|nr:hypothetical protein EV421DRAFT_1733258 [Armillaria borealis]
MSELSKKLFTRCLCPTALIIAKYPWRTYFVFVCLLLLYTRVPEHVALGSFIGVITPFIWTLLMMQRDEDNAKDVAFKNLGLQFNELNAYINSQRVSCQANTGESDAFHLCSVTVTQQCLVSKQKADAVYSAARAFSRFGPTSWFAELSLCLRDQEAIIKAVIENYSAFRVTLVATAPQNQLAVAQQWVAEINAAFPPIAADPVDEALL